MRKNCYNEIDNENINIKNYEIKLLNSSTILTLIAFYFSFTTSTKWKYLWYTMNFCVDKIIEIERNYNK